MDALLRCRELDTLTIVSCWLKVCFSYGVAHVS